MKKMRILITTIAVLFSAPFFVGAESNQVSDVKIEVNKQPLNLLQPPLITDGHTLVPLRSVFQALGAEVKWDEAVRTITATKGSIKLVMKIGENVAYSNGHSMNMEAAPIQYNNVTMVPIRFVSEALGCEVKWDGNTRVVSITDTNQQVAQKSLVALGDSITFGYNLGENNDHPSEYAFPFLIGKAENYQVNDLGVPGWTSNDLVNALQTANFQAAIRQANIITLNIGSNDLLQAASGLIEQEKTGSPIQMTAQDGQKLQNALTQIGNNVPKIIGSIKALNPQAKIIVYNLYNPFPTNFSLHDTADKLVGLANSEIASAASNSNVLLADAYSAFNNNQLTLVRAAEGDIHPTVEGQKVLAQIAEG